MRRFHLKVVWFLFQVALQVALILVIIRLVVVFDAELNRAVALDQGATGSGIYQKLVELKSAKKETVKVNLESAFHLTRVKAGRYLAATLSTLGEWMASAYGDTGGEAVRAEDQAGDAGQGQELAVNLKTVYVGLVDLLHLEVAQARFYQDHSRLDHLERTLAQVGSPELFAVTPEQDAINTRQRREEWGYFRGGTSRLARVLVDIVGVNVQAGESIWVFHRAPPPFYRIFARLAWAWKEEWRGTVTSGDSVLKLVALAIQTRVEAAVPWQVAG